MAKIYYYEIGVEVDTNGFGFTVCDKISCQKCQETVQLTDVKSIIYGDSYVAYTDWHLTAKCPICGAEITFIHTQYHNPTGFLSIRED